MAVKRFPVGDASYERTITVSSTIADQIRHGQGVVVQPGVDGNGRYDGAATGNGSTAGIEDGGLLIISGLAVGLGAVELLIRRRIVGARG